MKVSEMYPSKYLKAEEFAEGEVRVYTIKNYEMAEMTNSTKKTENKCVLSFREPGAKDLVLNKTNAAAIAKLYGEEADDWIGKKIALSVLEVESFGDVVQAIRVKNKIPTAADARASAMDDDIFGEDEPPPLHWSETDEGKRVLRAAKELGYANQAEVRATLNVTDWKQYEGTADDAIEGLKQAKLQPA